MGKSEKEMLPVKGSEENMRRQGPVKTLVLKGRWAALSSSQMITGTGWQRADGK